MLDRASEAQPPVPNGLMLGDPNSRVLLFSSEIIHRTQGGAAPLWRQQAQPEEAKRIPG